MTEEVKPAVAEKQYTPAEEKAISNGWTPKDEWVGAGKDPDEWKDARTFNRDGEYMDRIERQSAALERNKSKIDNLEKSLKMLLDHNSKIAQIERDRVLNELKAQKREALRDNDADKVIEIDDKISEVKQETIQAKEEKGNPTVGPDPEVMEWLSDSKNSWFHEDFELHTEADKFFRFKAGKGTMTTKEILNELEKHIQEKYPQKFGKTKKSAATPRVAEAGDIKSPSRPAEKKYTVKDLEDTEVAAIKQWVKTGGAKSVQEYIDQLAETGYFRNRQ